MLTVLKYDVKINESLGCDKEKQKVTAKSCERKWSLKIEQNNINI